MSATFTDDLMPDRPLDNDSLGKKGETRFGELCVDAKLIANVASWDRAGWDYIVDFRLPRESRRLDARPAPITARVQVKTQWEDQGAVKLRLSSAEQLIKHHGPSFICVLSVDANREFTRMRLIHCRGPVIARVLERLRRAEAAGERPNAVWLNLNPEKYAPAIPPTPEALRAGLEEACRADQLAYLKEKDSEIRTLGFGEAFMELKTTLVGDEDEIQDAFLGLRPIEAERIEAIQTRFGISLPYDDLPISSGTMHFEAEGEACTVSFRSGQEEIAFKAKAYRLPSLVVKSVSKPKLVIRNDLFSITLVITSKPNETTLHCTFKLVDELVDAARTTKAWRDVYKAFCQLNTEGVDLTIRMSRLEPLRSFLKMEAAPEKQGNWRRLARLTKAADDLFQQAGLSRTRVKLSDLWQVRDELEPAAALITSPAEVGALKVSTAADWPVSSEAPLPTLFGHAFKVGDMALAYAAQTTLHGVRREDGDVDWTSENLEFVAVKRVSSASTFHRFMQMQERSPCTLLSGIYNDDGVAFFYSPAVTE